MENSFSVEIVSLFHSSLAPILVLGKIETVKEKGSERRCGLCVF